jgi:hypothetical protein
VLRADGRFLLRACLYAQGIRNDLTEPLIRQVFTGWRIVSLHQRPNPERHPADDRLRDSTGASPKT